MLLNTSRGGVKKAFEYLVRLPFSKPLLHRLSEAARGKYLTFFSLHRILDEGPELLNHPHRISKSALTALEARHILLQIKKTLPFVSLAHALKILKGHASLNKSAAVLLVEAPYAQTLKHLVPLAHELKIPLTIALSTSSLLTGEPLWMDEISYGVLTTPKQELRISFIDRSLSLTSRAERVLAVQHIINNLSNCSLSTLRTRLAELREILQESAILPMSERICTASQLLKLEPYGISFVVAGNDHVPCVSYNSEEALREVARSKYELFAMLGDALDPVYIYPLGLERQPPELMKLLMSAGYEAALSRHIGVCRPGDNMFRLARLPLGLEAKSFEQFELQGLADAIDEFLLVALNQDEGL